MCALDFSRALNSRPAIARWAVRRLLGKFAVAEYMGLQRALQDSGYDPDMEYDPICCVYLPMSERK